MRLYGGVRIVNGPSPLNVRRLDAQALPWAEAAAAIGIQVDLDYFAKMEKDLGQEMDSLTEEVHRMTGVYTNLDSGDQVSKLLFKGLGLKQARVKMTRGRTNSNGDLESRESVDSDVLDNIKHDHPVVPLIQSFKECSKLRGTYCRPIINLARKAHDGTWRLFPNFKYTRVPSGRLACVAKGTPIEVLRDSHKYPKGIPIEDVKPGDLAYCFDGNSKLTIRPVKAVHKTGTRKVLRLFWEGTGKKHYGFLDLTADHRVRLSTGLYCEAQDLRIGDSLCSLSRGLDAYGYSRIWATGRTEIPKEHRFVWETLKGKLPETIHHINENKGDNRPDNLEGLSNSEHASIHSRNPLETTRDKHRDNYYGPNGLVHRTWEQRSQAQDNHKLKLTKEWIERELIRCQGRPTKVCRQNKIDYATLQKYMLSEGVDWKAIKLKSRNNHRVVYIQELEEPCEVYDLEIEDTHNFIAGEICVHNCEEPNLLAIPAHSKRAKLLRNGFITRVGWKILTADFSQIEPRVAAHRSKCKSLIKIYEGDEDLYSDFAITAFKLQDGRYRDDSGKWIYPHVLKDEHRFPAKTCVLASLYDVTAPGLLAQMPVGKGWTENKCQDLINAFYLKFPELLVMRRLDHSRAHRYMMVWDMWGRILHTPGVKSVHPWVVSATLRELANHPIQGSACGIFKLAMAECHDIWEQAGLQDVIHPLLPIHDELLYECQEGYEEEWMNIIGGVFEKSCPMLVDIKWSGDSADNWGLVSK